MGWGLERIAWEISAREVSKLWDWQGTGGKFREEKAHKRENIFINFTCFKNLPE